MKKSFLSVLFVINAVLLIFPLANEASFFESLVDRERQGFFVEINSGVGIIHTVQTSHPDMKEYSFAFGSVGSKLGYFLSDSIGVYLGTSGSSDGDDVIAGNVGVIFFSGYREGLTPYVYGEYKTRVVETGGYGVGIGAGIPIHRWVSIDTSLSLERAKDGYFTEVPTGIKWHPYTLDYRIGEITNVVFTFGISFWLF